MSWSQKSIEEIEKDVSLSMDQGVYLSMMRQHMYSCIGTAPADFAIRFNFGPITI